MARRDSILLQYISSFQKKQCEQKWNHKLSSGLQIFKITLWKPGGAKEPKQCSKLWGDSSDFSSSLWTVSPEVYLRGGLPAHDNLYWEWWWGLRQQRQAFGELTLRCKQTSCRQQQIINLLIILRSRLDPLWQKWFLWSTSLQVLCRAIWWCAVPCGGGAQPVVCNNFFLLGVLPKWIVQFRRTALYFYTLCTWTTPGLTPNNHNLNTLNWAISDKLRTERPFLGKTDWNARQWAPFLGTFCCDICLNVTLHPARQMGASTYPPSSYDT